MVLSMKIDEVDLSPVRNSACPPLTLFVDMTVLVLISATRKYGFIRFWKILSPNDKPLGARKFIHEKNQQTQMEPIVKNESALYQKS